MAALRMNAKVAASTLLEVIVAMVVILIVFAMATAVYLNVIRTAPSVRNQQISAVARGMMEMTDEDVKETSVVVDSIFYEKKRLSYPGYSDLQLLEVTASQNGKELIRLSKVVKSKDDE